MLNNAAVSDNAPSAKKRMYYTKEEEQIVTTHFNLTTRTTPAKSAECLQFLQSNQVGHLFKGRSVQSIQDKVKTIIRQLHNNENTTDN